MKYQENHLYKNFVSVLISSLTTDKCWFSLHIFNTWKSIKHTLKCQKKCPFIQRVNSTLFYNKGEVGKR